MEQLEQLCEELLTDSKLDTLQQLLQFIKEQPEFVIDLWHHPLIPIFFIQEIVSSYTIFDEPISSTQQKRLIIILKLIQYFIDCQTTRNHLLYSQIIYYLFPFINNNNSENINIRTTVLFIIHKLLLNGDDLTIGFFVNTELIPLTLKVMEFTDKERVLGMSIFLAMFNNQKGLEYTCQTFERFMAVSTVFNSLLEYSAATGNYELLTMILKCYLRFASRENARMCLITNKPTNLESENVKRSVTKNVELKKLYCDLIDKTKGM